MKHGSIDALYMSAFPAFALLAGLRLDVFTALAQGPADAAGVAARLGVAPGRLGMLLDALVAAGVVVRGDGRYTNGPEADRTLVRGRPDWMDGLGDLYLDRYLAALGADRSIRDDAPSAKKDFSAMSPEQAAAFFGGMFRRAEAAGHDLAGRFDLSWAGTAVDAGGGSGGLAVGLCRALPALRVTVADLAPVLPIARERIAEAGLADRIDVLEADVVARPLPGRYDLAIVRSVLQVLSDADAARALANVAAAVRPGGRVIVGGRMLDDDGLAPEASVSFNLVFMSLYAEGRSYTEARYRAWFRAAGLVDVERIALPGGHSLMHGRRAGAAPGQTGANP